MDKGSISRINALSALARQRPLTQEEMEERTRLRDAYRAAFRAQFVAQIENTVVEYPDGTTVPLKDAAKKEK